MPSTQNSVPSAEILTHCDVFTRERSPLEIDLVAECRKVLIDHGAGALVAANFDTNRLIKQAENLNTEGQRFLLNRFWTFQLNRDPVNSQQARYALLGEGEYKMWLSSFKTFVLPFILENNLPAPL